MRSTGVLVVGSLNLDHTLKVARLPGPGETVLATGLTVGLGGKGANQAVAAARAGAATAFVACVGSDARPLVGPLADDGIDVTHVFTHADLPTGAAYIVVDDRGENSIVVNLGANTALAGDNVARAVEDLSPQVVLAPLEAPIEAVDAMLAEPSAIRIVNAAPFDVAIVERLERIDVLVVNGTEHDALVGAGGEMGPDRVLIVTRGADGVDILRGTDQLHIPSTPVEPVDTTGAGDTLCGYLAAGLAGGLEIVDAARWASSAAAVSTTRPGAASSIPHTSEVDWP